MSTGNHPELQSKEYWCGEMHHIDEIGFDSERNLKLYRPRGKNGIWVVDPKYRPDNEDYLMKRHIRLLKSR